MVKQEERKDLSWLEAIELKIKRVFLLQKK
jgi:hypothetical protein